MKIICIGRNYSEHAKELNNEVPSVPLYFMKPDVALLSDNKDFYYPSFTNDVHYECELVVKIDKMGKCIEKHFANRYYSKISLGIDFTARDIQEECKAKGMPWEKAKSFDNSAVLSSNWIPKEDLEMEKLTFSLQVNGKEVQHGNSSNMLFSIDDIISYVSQFVTLKTGDLIFTGTPSGVGPVNIGDKLTGFLEGQEMFSFSIR
jgi:2-keto-4-pentenoate hydratase/2-oxohepta-3-ene-1,7-dioic acid hydratase in catechol pathway